MNGFYICQKYSKQQKGLLHMETPVTHWEYKQLEELMDAKVESLEKEDKRLSKRLEEVESLNQQIRDMNLNMQKQSSNVEILAKNMESICKIQEAEGQRLQELEKNRITDNEIKAHILQQDERLKAIETADYEKYKAAKKQVRTTAITVVATAVITAILSVCITFAVQVMNAM